MGRLSVFDVSMMTALFFFAQTIVFFETFSGLACCSFAQQALRNYENTAYFPSAL
jgi:hypothetical protein